MDDDVVQSKDSACHMNTGEPKNSSSFSRFEEVEAKMNIIIHRVADLHCTRLSAVL